MRRLQIDLNENDVQILEWLEKMTGSRTHKDLFDNSLTLLQWAVEQKVQQRTVASLDPGSKSYRELHMPALQRAAAIGVQQANQEHAAKVTSSVQETKLVMK
jgi:hypothetical protein